MDTPEDLRGFNTLFFVTEVIGLVGVVMMAVWTANYRGGFAWTSNPSHQFNWHPLLMTIGMIYLFANCMYIEATVVLICIVYLHILYLYSSQYFVESFFNKNYTSPIKEF